MFSSLFLINNSQGFDASGGSATAGDQTWAGMNVGLGGWTPGPVRTDVAESESPVGFVEATVTRISLVLALLVMLCWISPSWGRVPLAGAPLPPVALSL
jgi:hypothetical protein